MTGLGIGRVEALSTMKN